MRLQLLTTLLLPFVAFASQEQQVPMLNEQSTPYSPQITSKPSLADLLTIESSASIFYSYARELELSARLSDPNAQTTVFVPSNRAVMALARKPHEGPTPLEGGDIHISEVEFDKRSKKNVERWISAHVVPESLTNLEAGEYSTLLDGKKIRLTPISKADSLAPAWNRLIVEDGIHITGMKEGLNGVLYFTDGTILSA